MAYSADSFVADEVPTTAKWNKLWSNDAAFNDGTGFAADAIVDSKLVYGKLRARRGGSATDWTTPGTTNYDYDAVNVIRQVGSVTSGGDGVDVGVTYPVAYGQKPWVIASILNIVNSNAYVCNSAITTTGFNTRNLTAGAAGGNYIGWVSEGQPT